MKFLSGPAGSQGGRVEGSGDLDGPESCGSVPEQAGTSRDWEAGMRLSWAVGDITGKNTQRAAAAGLVMATALLSASGPRRSFLRRLRGARAS